MVFAYNTLSAATVSPVTSFIESKSLAANSHTVWERVRLGSNLHWEIEEHRLKDQLDWHRRNTSHIYQVSQRAERYIHYVTEQLELRGLPLELALLPMVESTYDPFAYSHADASGIWQFTPAAAIDYRLHEDEWYDARRDVIESTQAALNYLENLHRSFDGDWLLALAAYNAGPGTVRKAIRKNQALGHPTDFWSLSLPRETSEYVPKLFALAKLLEMPDYYGVTWHPVKNRAYFAVVDTHSQIDLAKASTLSGVNIGELYRLNPGFNRWVTAPEGPHRLLVPVERARHFTNRLSSLSAADRLQWQDYTVQRGDSLEQLAQRHHTHVAMLRDINQLKSNNIHAGQSLVVPVAVTQGISDTLSSQQIRNQRKQPANTQQVAHQVKQGDSLWSIARYYDVTVSKLASWNNIDKRATLHPGQQLSLWVDNSSAVVASGQLM